MTASGEPPRKLTRRQERLAAQLHTTELDELYAQRLSLLRELHGEGWTMPELGKLLGLSKQRVQQLLKGT